MANITIVGAGYVGLSSAAVINPEHTITVRDIDPAKIAALNAQQIPINEPKMAEMLFVEGRPISFEEVGDYLWLKDTDILIVAVGTPTLAGSTQADTSIIDEIIDKVDQINPDVKIVIKSTVPIMYCDQIVDKYGVQVMHIPEFLRQGTAVQDALTQKHWIIGKSSNIKAEVAREIGEMLYKTSEDVDKQFHVVPNRTAALAKLARNTYLALHIAYANELNQLCHATDVSYSQLKELMGYDSRIHPTYMSPSPGFGGSCLPKDTRSISYQYSKLVPEWLPAHSRPEGLLAAIVDNNLKTLGCAYEWVLRIVQKHPECKRIGVFGLTFKAGTDDLRESRYFDIMKSLGEDTELKYTLEEIAGYDDNIQDEKFAGHCLLSTGKTVEEIIQKSDILIINHAKYAYLLDDASAKVIIDFTGCVKPELRKEVYSWIA